MKYNRLIRLILLCGMFATCVFAVCSDAVGQAPPQPNISSSQPPADVEIPPNFPPTANPIDFFDDFSWRTFVAMVWPALDGQRGTPDPAKKVGGLGPRVFETFKALHEVFHSDGTAPAAWNAFDLPQYNPCDIKAAFGDVTLGSFSKFSNLGQADFGSLVGPLIAQNGTYVRFLTTYNNIEFAQIMDQTLYRRPTPPAAFQVTFKNGAIDTKSAWMDMKDAKHPERYYTRQAWVLDPVTGIPEKKLVGLVGLHIVVKTQTRPQWIWTTFEQVDNVPPLEDGNDGAFGPGTSNFHDATQTPMPDNNPFTMDRVLQPPTPRPFNVERVKPNLIHPQTQQTNKGYRAALQGTVWQNYQLVATQWPLSPNAPSLPGTPKNTFPGTIGSAFANTTLESFDQKKIGTGCMACHTATKDQTDFLWSLNDHAFPADSGAPNLIMKNSAMRTLRDTLKSAAEK
jgi:hypothetical protein